MMAGDRMSRWGRIVALPPEGGMVSGDSMVCNGISLLFHPDCGKTHDGHWHDRKNRNSFTQQRLRRAAQTMDRRLMCQRNGGGDRSDDGATQGRIRTKILSGIKEAHGNRRWAGARKTT